MQGCCSTCEITLATMKELSTTQLKLRMQERNDDKHADYYNVLKAQYTKSIQAIKEGTEVACSEYCVCKETEIDRLSEFPSAPSLGSIHDLVDRVSQVFKRGQNVVDFGCGTGHDSFKIAPLISPGTITGIDLTPEMIAHAQDAAQKLAITNARFIEASDLTNIPVNSLDVILMNNVYNMLTPDDKRSILEQAKKCLKNRGILIISDEFSKNQLPDSVRNDPQLQCGGIAGAQTMDSFVSLVENTSFKLVNHEIVKKYTVQHGPETFQLYSAYFIFQRESI